VTSTALRPGAPTSSPPDAPDIRWSPWELLPPLLVLLLGAMLLRPGHGLWFDELFTAEVARLPLGDIVSAITSGQGTASYLAGVPPSYNAPYYLVVHLWMSLPGLGGDTSLRVLSLLATAGGLALICRAIARLGGLATGILAGCVLAVSPLVLEQAVEARSYGLAVLAGLAVRAWAGEVDPLLYLTVGLAILGGVRAAAGLRAVAASWVLVPLLLLLAAELVRPVYLPRYLLAGLLGLGVLAAAGAMTVPRAARAPVAALLVACSLLAAQPLFSREPRERSDDLVRLLAEVQRRGEPIVAADQRSATGLDHYVRTLAPELRPDVVLPPDDAPVDAERVWLVRRLMDGVPEPTDDDEILAAGGFRQVGEDAFPGSKTDLVLQRWEH
jgi:hypothetical protein